MSGPRSRRCWTLPEEAVAQEWALKSGQTLIDKHGQEIFNHVEANLHWGVFQFLGKLTSLVYVLRSPTKGPRG